jgi:signal transduction histidine kinase
MKIATIEYINAAISVVLVTAMGMMLVYTGNLLDSAIRQAAVTQDAALAVSEIRYLIDEYLEDHYERQKQQWYQRYGSMVALLQQDPYTDAAQKTVIANSRQRLALLRQTVDSIVANYEAEQANGAPLSGVSREFERKLTARARQLNQDMTSDFSRLAQDTSRALASIANLRSTAAMVGMIVLALLIIVNLLVTKLYILTPLARLQRSMTRVAAGDLDTRNGNNAANEIGSLSRDFDHMVGQIQAANVELAQHRTQLMLANNELEAFSYSVAHDLRAPLRSIDGFSAALLEDYADKLDEDGKVYLGYVRESAQQMAQLIDDLLSLSRVTRAELHRSPIDLAAIARTILAHLQRNQPDRTVELVMGGEMPAFGDADLLRIVLENLLGNAWKFTGKCSRARIEFGQMAQTGGAVFFVRDNGAGFDMAYADKLFGVFQRLHSVREFDGNGIGLSIVQRVIRRHGGRVWAEGEVGRGAIFFFTLGEDI